MRGISRMKEPQHAEDLCWVSRFAAAEAGAGVNDLPAPVQDIGCGDEETSVWEPLIRRLDVRGMPRRPSAERDEQAERLGDPGCWIDQQRGAHRFCTMKFRRRADGEPAGAELPDLGQEGTELGEMRLTRLTANARMKAQYDRAGTAPVGDLDRIAVSIVQCE